MMEKQTENKSKGYCMKSLLCSAIHLGYYNRPNVNEVLNKIKNCDKLNKIIDSDNALWATYRMYQGVVSPDEILSKFIFENEEVKSYLISVEKEVKLDGS